MENNKAAFVEDYPSETSVSTQMTTTVTNPMIHHTTQGMMVGYQTSLEKKSQLSCPWLHTWK